MQPKDLIETQMYEVIQGGHFVHKFSTESPMGGIGFMALPGSIVMFDQQIEDMYIFI